MYRYTTNVEPGIYDYTGDNWSHQTSNKMFKEIFGNDTRKTDLLQKTAILGTSLIIRKCCSLKLEA